MDNCTFINNIATYGGAINVECNYLNLCTNVIKNSNFINNTALSRGGAIKYSSYVPTLENNRFENNIADFSENIASYAVRVFQVVDEELVEIERLDNIASGMQLDNVIALALTNSQGKVMVNDNESSIRIIPLTNITEVAGQDTVRVINGVGTFTAMELTAAPGLDGIEFLLFSSAIDYDMIKHIDPEKYPDQVFTVNFRWCKPGEIQRGNICTA